MTIKREPRIEAAKKTMRPRQPWEAVYETYTPLENPLPLNILALYFFGEAQIWALGGDPDVDILCEVIAMTDPGTIEEHVEPGEAWDLLCYSLTGLCFGKGAEMRQAFQAACAILNDVIATQESVDDARTATQNVAKRVAEELAEDDEYEDQPAENDQMTLPTTKCIICGEPSEVTYPDGEGDQVHYCGYHEPTETRLREARLKESS